MSHITLLTATQELESIIQSAFDSETIKIHILKALCEYFNARYVFCIDDLDGREVVNSCMSEPIVSEEMEQIATLLKKDSALLTQAQSYAQPRIINNISRCKEFAALTSLPRDHAHHLLIVPLKHQHQSYAVIYIFRHENQAVFLEHDREVAFGIALYLSTSWVERVARNRAVYTRVISADILQNTYIDFHHYRQAQQIIANPQSVIRITGEVGVGKTHFVEYIHALSSARGAPLLTIDCSWLTGTHLDELPAEYTSTVLILNIDTLNHEQQKLLIEMIKTQPAHQAVQRNIFVETSATERMRSASDVAACLFDLTVSIEPLRRYTPQIARIFRHLLAIDNKKAHIAQDVEQQLNKHQWHENFAGLMRAYAYNKELPDNREGSLNVIDLHFEQGFQPRSLREAMNDYRQSYITSALRRYNGNQTHAAKALNIQRTYLNKLLNTWYK